MIFVVFIPDKKAAKVRLVEARDREAFAKACGTPGNPAATENAARARPS